MNKDFLLKENLLRKNLLLELRYSLPTFKLLEIANAAFFELPNGQVLVLKNRNGGSLNKSNAVIFDNFNATEEEIQSLSRKVVEIKFSGFNQRGQNAILDYIAAAHREQMKLVLEGKKNQSFEETKGNDSMIFGEQSPEDFFQRILQMGTPFITSHKSGSGKTELVENLAKNIPPLFSSLAVLFENNVDASDVSGMRSLYRDCNMIAELENGQVKFIKSREDVKNISPEMEFLVLMDLSQLQFYPKGFFKGKNVLIAK